MVATAIRTQLRVYLHRLRPLVVGFALVLVALALAAWPGAPACCAHWQALAPSCAGLHASPDDQPPPQHGAAHCVLCQLAQACLPTAAACPPLPLPYRPVVPRGAPLPSAFFAPTTPPPRPA
ncbi:hypothetical protein F8S13_11465 [Chloroflexia bacterium SDU3-3]|nr:hypothetical protein F8S13_11465 [Chloroflexia bacterium SDU3-3]